MSHMNKILVSIFIISNFLCLSQSHSLSSDSHLNYLSEKSNEIKF
jgi:hypothetical protein